MGRNTVGGKKGKSMANKDFGNNNHSRIRLSEDPLELYACVTKCNGNGMFAVETNDGQAYIAHVRGKMRGPTKRNNFVSAYSIVLVGLREYESIKKNCDIIAIYNSHDIHLLSQIPNINISRLLTMHMNNGQQSNEASRKNDELFMFSNDDEVDLVPKQNLKKKEMVIEEENSEQEEFNFDDI